MKIIERAAHEAAKRGIVVSVIQFDGSNLAPDVDDAYAEGTTPPTEEDSSDKTELVKRIRELEGDLTKQEQASKLTITSLEKQVQQGIHHTGSINPLAEVNENLKSSYAALVSENTALKSTLVESNEKLMTALATPANGNGAANGDAGLPLASFEMYDVATLGLSEKAASAAKRVKATTVGELKAALVSGALAAKNLKVSQPSRLEIANKLLGQIPAAATAAPERCVSGEMAPISVDFPSWERRLEAAYKKETFTNEWRGKKEALAGQIATLKAQQTNPDIEVQIAALEKKFQNADKMFGMYEGQAIGLLWTLGLPFDFSKVGSVSGALTAKGLPHLITETPQPSNQA